MMRPLLCLALLIAPLAAQSFDEKLLEPGRRLLATGRVRDAATVFDQLVELHPGEARPLHMAGLAYSRARRFRRGLDRLEKARELAPNDDRITYDLGATHFNRASYEEALTILTPLSERLDAGERRAQAASVAYLRGVCAQRLERTTEALEALRLAVSLQPDDLASRRTLGEVLFNSGRYELAIVQFSAVTERTPEVSDAWYFLGAAQAEAGRLEDARTSLEQACRLDGANARAWERLGRVHLVLDDSRRAQAAFQMAVQANPLHFEALKNLATLANRAGRRDEARAFLKRFESVSNRSRQLTEQMRTLRRRWKRDPMDIAARHEAVEMLLRHAQTDEAGDVLQAILRVDPKNKLAAVNLAQLFATEGQWEEAFHEHDRVVEVDPTHAISWFESARCLALLDRHAEAVPRFLKALPGTSPTDERYARTLQEAWLSAARIRRPDKVFQAIANGPKVFRGKQRTRIELLLLHGQAAVAVRSANPPIQALEDTLYDLGPGDPLLRPTLETLVQMAQLKGDGGRVQQYAERLRTLDG